MQKKLCFFSCIFHLALLWTDCTNAVIIKNELDIDSTHQFIMDSTLRASKEAQDVHARATMQHMTIFYSHQILDSFLEKKSSFSFTKESVLSIITFHTNHNFFQLLARFLQERDLEFVHGKNLYALKSHNPALTLIIRNSQSKEIVAQIFPGFSLSEPLIEAIIDPHKSCIVLYKNSIPCLSPSGYIVMDYVKIPYIAQMLKEFMESHRLINKKHFFGKLLEFCSLFREFSVVLMRESILEECSFHDKKQYADLIDKIKSMTAELKDIASQSAVLLDQLIPGITWDFYRIYEVNPYKKPTEPCNVSDTSSEGTGHDYANNDAHATHANAQPMVQVTDQITDRSVTPIIEGTTNHNEEDLNNSSDRKQSPEIKKDESTRVDYYSNSDNSLSADDGEGTSTGELSEDGSTSNQKPCSLRKDLEVTEFSEKQDIKIHTALNQTYFRPPSYDLSPDNTATTQNKKYYEKHKKPSTIRKEKAIKKTKSGNRISIRTIKTAPFTSKHLLREIIQNERVVQQDAIDSIIKNKKTLKKNSSHTLETAGLLVLTLFMVYSPDALELVMDLGPVLPAIISLISILYVSLDRECSPIAKILSGLSVVLSAHKLGSTATLDIMHQYQVSHLPERLSIFPEHPLNTFTLPNGNNVSIYQPIGDIETRTAPSNAIKKWYVDTLYFYENAEKPEWLTWHHFKNLMRFCGLSEDVNIDLPCISNTLEQFNNIEHPDLGLFLLYAMNMEAGIPNKDLMLVTNKVTIQAKKGSTRFAEIQPCYSGTGRKKKCRRFCQYGYQQKCCKLSTLGLPMEDDALKPGEYTLSSLKYPGHWKVLVGNIHYPSPNGESYLTVQNVPESGIYVIHLSNNPFSGPARFFFVEKKKVKYFMTVHPD